MVTTESAATTALSPIITPGRTVTFDPIHTLVPMTMGAGCMSARRDGSRSWFNVAGTVLCPIRQPSSMTAPSWSWNLHPELMKIRLPRVMFFPKSE